MFARTTLTGMFAGSALFFLSLVSLVGAETKDSETKDADGTLSAQVAKAARVLIATPEKDVDVPGGEQFLVEIKNVLRGTGTVGKLARITNSGDKERHPRYKAGKQYVFLLMKNAAGSGWLNSGLAELPIENDKVMFLVDGKVKEEVTLVKLAELASGVDPGPVRESLPGKWTLIMSRQGSDMPLLLIDVTKNEKGAYQARLIEASKNLGASTLKEYSITDTDVHLVILADEEIFDFRGKVDAGKVRGAMVIPDVGMVAASWLTATEVDKLPGDDAPQKTAGRDEFVEAASQEKEAFDPLLKFVRRYPDSPLALDAYTMLIQLGAMGSKDPAKFKKLADEYLQAAAKWSPVLELRAYIDLGTTLSRANNFGDLALEYLRTAEKKMTADVPQQWDLLIQIEIGTRMLGGGQLAEGLEFLKKLHEKHPFEAQLTWMLAQLSEQSKDIEGAIALYADISALPMMEGMLVQTLSQGNQKFPREQFPNRVLARLWKEKHGDMKGLPHFLDEAYEKRMSSLGGPLQAPRKAGEGNRVVLCELLTGSACPPCVAADVATIALEATYAKSEVIVLRYHQHSPAPDPLANDDTGERFTSYDAEGTPMIYVNGKLFPGAGGFMPQVPEIFRRLKKVVEPYLAEKTNLKLDLSAQAENGRIAISAKASGVKTFPEDVHLRLVLAEDKIPFLAGNGIRFHEMIVRVMPGGPDGIEPEKGQLSYEGEVDLGKLRTQLTQSLSKIENAMAKQFDSKPLDFNALHLVAFLQNDDTGEVLQAAAIPVAGTLKITGETAKPAASKTARTKAPAGNAK